MLPYYDSDENLQACHDFCDLWRKSLPELRADMYRIISDIGDSDENNDMSVYSFEKNHQAYKFWLKACNIIKQIAHWQDCNVQTILYTMPSHLFIKLPRMMYVHAAIGCISTAKTIVEYWGLDPAIRENKYGSLELLKR